MSGNLKVILYTDGGFNQYDNRPNVSGYGIHGYVYTDELPKKGTGNPKAVPTDNGYEGPCDTNGGVIEGAKVTVLNYVDIIGGRLGLESSGHVELAAFIEALKWMDGKEEIIGAKIFSDSRYVIDSVNKYLASWVSKDWTRHDGSKVKYTDEWKECDALLTKLRNRIKIDAFWIKGHNGHLGNETADELATKGKIAVENNRSNIDVRTKEVVSQGYWSKKPEIPRILQAPRWYFDTIDKSFKDEEGFSSFYVGCHGSKDKEVELTGKPYSDNFLGVIKTKFEDPVTEALREYVLTHQNARTGRVVVAGLDQIYSSKLYSDLKEDGVEYLRKSRDQILINTPDRTLLLSEMQPQGQGYRMVSVWKSLETKLKEIHSGSDRYQFTDLTETLFEVQGKKETFKLKAEWNSRSKTLSANAKVNLSTALEAPDVFEQKIKLIFGQDILSRNQLAALAEDVESVSIVTWRESDEVARYGTYVLMKNGDHGLWARYDSNTILAKR